MKRIVILGAGLCGLSLAWFLKRRFGARISLQILEKSERPGGWIQTVLKEGFLFEQGPRSCRVKGAGIETLKLLEQLELLDQVIPADSSAHFRYIWKNNKLQCLPSGPFSFLFSPLMPRIFCGCIKDLLTKSSTLEDESIYEFISRRFGRNIAEDLIDPLTKGIYAGDIKQLSIQSCFPLLYEMEKQSGSVLKGFFKRKRDPVPTSPELTNRLKGASLFTLKGGMEDLTQELAARLDEHIIYSTEVKTLRSHPSHVEVGLENGVLFEADHVFSTIPAFSLASLLGTLHQELLDLLSLIPTVSVAVVNLGFHKKVLKRKGFGYLIPSSQKENVLGVVWDSSIFPQQNQIPEETRLTVMIGGAMMQNVQHQSHGAFLEIAREAIDRQLNIDEEPSAYHVTIARQAIPQYFVGHQARISKIKLLLSKLFPKLTLHGNFFHGVSMNDCIANSKRIEEKLRFDVFGTPNATLNFGN